MILNFKYKLKPNKDQESALNQHCFSSNQAWNHILDIKIKNLKRRRDFHKRSCLKNKKPHHLWGGVSSNSI